MSKEKEARKAHDKVVGDVMKSPYRKAFGENAGQVSEMVKERARKIDRKQK